MTQCLPLVYGTVGTDSEVNKSSYRYIARLFATVDGISKVGSYTGNGNTKHIDCGFTNGAVFYND